MSGRRVQRTGLGTETVAARVGVRPHRVLVGPEALTFVSLFDDTADVWSDEDFRLVEPLYTVSRWSRPDEFAAVLSEAA